MAVYERRYRGYDGPVTPGWSRFLVIPRYAVGEIFRSRLLVMLLAVCGLIPLLFGVVIYLPHNLTVIEALGIDVTELLPVNAWFFLLFLRWQTLLGLFVALIVGPPLIAGDMRNNALPLYLSRPVTRREYILGKMCVLVGLLSAITWIPGLMLFSLQIYLGGFTWLRENPGIGVGLFVGAWLWVLVLSLLSLAVSAVVRWKPVARIVIFAIIFVGSAVGQMINIVSDSSVGSLINLSENLNAVWAWLFSQPAPTEFPLIGSWIVCAAVAAGSLAMLTRRIRAYEVSR